MARRRGVLLGTLLALGLIVAPAGATETTVDCAELQSALSGAKAGDRIVLDELCKSGFPYKLPSLPVTLAGTPGAGFDGGTTAQLEGTKSTPTIEGLIFENATNPAVESGGALTLNVVGAPATVTLLNDRFVNDHAPNGEGGGARINTDPALVTVTGTTFSGNSAGGPGGGLVVYAGEAKLSADTFTGNTASGPSGGGGGLVVSAVGAPISLSASEFSGNSATDGGGGAVLENQAFPVGFVITGNTFSHNTVADAAGESKDSRGYLGGGLSLFEDSAEPTSVVQSGNVFDSNSVSFKAAPVSAMGGGESATHVALTSTGDRFTNNTLQSPSEAKNTKAEHVWGWGAGLSVTECGDPSEASTTAPSVVSTLTDAVVAHNTLLSGPSANGAGIYVGFVCATAYTALQVADSTISGNLISGAAGPVAGISGGPRDTLGLANTILAGDSGPELGGFNGLAGVTASYSDVCSGAAPFAGTGNVCADPKLAAPGSGDVHETAASPTLEAGSNALVPGGLATDAYGGPRILGPLGCSARPAAVVDIGAAEYAYPVPPCVPPAPLGPVISDLKQSASKWRVGGAAAHLSSRPIAHIKRPPVGTTFTFTLDRAAVVTLRFTTVVPGRRVGRRCVEQSKRNRHKKRCSRTITAGVLSFNAHAGTDKIRFYGVLSGHRRLRPGAYTMTATATASGLSGAARTLHFTIVR
ncbi:MAG TPA: hypothetical protein VN618_14610 [Solirubrobacteraceae bacterium]|nr:hypothetical protein [Solirubrobacteraceae bacterium]